MLYCLTYKQGYDMDRLSARLSDQEFTTLGSMGGKNRTDNLKLAIKYAKKWKKKHGKNKSADTNHKAKKAKK